MIINCPNCNKKFEIDKDLIPFEGRLLQCGSCNNKWFFKLENIKEEIGIVEKKTVTSFNENNDNLSDEINNNSLAIKNETEEKSEISKPEFNNKVNALVPLLSCIISFLLSRRAISFSSFACCFSNLHIVRS